MVVRVVGWWAGGGLRGMGGNGIYLKIGQKKG